MLIMLMMKKKIFNFNFILCSYTLKRGGRKWMLPMFPSPSARGHLAGASSGAIMFLGAMPGVCSPLGPSSGN